MSAVVVSIVACLLLVVPLDRASDQSLAAEAHSDKGLQLAQDGNLRAAESELRTAVGLSPTNPEFLRNLATILAIEKKLEDSTTIFQRALKLDPGNLTARRYLAANLWQLHRYPEAKENLELILKQKSDDAPSRLLLGMVAENMKDYGTAERMLASVPQEVRKQPESLGALAVSYYHLGEKQKARSTLEELRNHPAGVRAVLLGAKIADENADYAASEELLGSIRTSYPDQAELGYRIATIQYHAGRFADSEQTLGQLVDSGNATGPVLNLLAWCHQKQNHPEQALAAFERAIALAPTDESNYLDLQRVLVADNRLAGALEVAKRTTDALPKSSRGFAMRGSIEMQSSQFSNAVASYRRAIELDPTAPDSALGLADAEFAADLRKEARASYEAGIRNFPKDARFRVHYASVLLKEADTGGPQVETRAETLLQSAVKLDPSAVEARCQLAELALKNGQTAEALREYTTAAKLEPHNPKVHFGLSKVYRRLGKTEDASREAELFQQLQSQTGPTLPDGARN